MKAAPRPRDTRGFSHSPGSRLSIDPNHHVTEAIGDMYGDYETEDRGSRYSFVSSAPGGGGNSEPSRAVKRQSTLSVPGLHGRGLGGGSGGLGGGFGGAGGGVPSNSQGSSTTPPSSVRSASPSPGEAVYPLNDIDYESDPVAVAQEISNLQALRRMSMDVSSAADPDLPSFNSFVPSTPPDDGDPGSIFWVPARLHPELAPQEFSAFLEAKKNEIRRPQSAGGGGGSLSPDGAHSGGPSLRRKKSMLSRQIDADSARNYRDGADRLEKRKSLLTDGNAAPAIQLDDLMKDPEALMHRLSADSRRRTEEGDQADDPIIFAPKVGLKRSTATHYRRGSTRRDRVGSKRGGKIAETDTEDYGPDAPRGFKLDRASTEPVIRGPSSREIDEPKQRQGRRSPPDSTSPSTSFDDLMSKTVPVGTASSTPGATQEKHKSAPAKARRSSSPRGTARGTRSSEPVPPVPKIVETPPPPSTLPIIELPERHSSFEPPNSSGSQKKPRPPVTNRLSDSAIDTSPSAGKAADHMTVPDAKGDKRDRKRPESSGSTTGKDRKTSWGWLLGDSDKAKEREEAKEREREERLKAKKEKRPKSADKSSEKYDNTRLDVLQKSIELGNTGKVVAADPVVPAAILVVEPPSRTDSRESRKSRGEDKKEKEKDSGFLSFFGGSKKKSGSEHQTDDKKSGSGGRSRGTSPDPATESRPKFYYTRFPIHIERAIYRLSHLKLANPRRPLHQQVLLSNFMYSYLALVQQTQPHLIQQQQASSSQQQKQQAAEQQRLQEQQRWQQRQEEEARLQQQQQRQHHDDGARDSDGYVDDSQGYDEYSDDETQVSGNHDDYYENDRDGGGGGNTYYDQQQHQQQQHQQQQQQHQQQQQQHQQQQQQHQHQQQQHQQQQQQQQDERDDMW